MTSRRKKFIFLALAWLLCVLLMEVSLQLAAMVSNRASYALFPNASMQVEDARLGHRPNPEFFEHDARGFRNDAVPDVADVVALGDSLTYGAMVAPEHSWPSQFSKIGRHSIYNMAFGGYGPGHELLLWEEALDFKPKLVVVSHYAGNDLFDCYNIVYGLNKKLPNYRSEEPHVLSALEATEQSSPIRLAGSRSSIHRFLKERVAVYGLLRAFRNAWRGTVWNYNEPTWSEVRAQPPKQGEYLYESESAQTVLDIARRLSAIDETDVRIREGKRLSHKFFSELRAKSASANLPVLVLLMPTKEFVFWEFAVRQEKSMPRDYGRLFEYERRMWSELKDHLDKEGLAWLDLTPTLREAVEIGKQPFRRDIDGHFSITGNQITAETVYQEIERRGLVETVDE